MVFAAASPELEGVSGKYLEDMRIVGSSSHSKGRQQQDRLWDQTVKALKPAIHKYSSCIPPQERESFLKDCLHVFSLNAE